MSVQIRKAVCFWCKAECGVDVHVKDSQLLKVEPDDDWPIKPSPPPAGCSRRRGAIEYFYHPGRINYPLKRVGQRGEGRWEKISWEKALDEIAEKLHYLRDQYGGETLAASGGTARTHDEYRSRFFCLFGSPNLFGQERICFGPRSIVADTIIGMFPHYSVSPNNKGIMLLGVEPLVSRPITARNIREAKKNGASLVVVDPRRTESASMADIWLPIRPSTDAALLLAMINVIIQEDLYDHDFVGKWCYGFDKLVKRASEYPPEKASEITGISAEKIREAARLFARSKPASCVEGEGLEHIYNSTQALHARWILSAITGNIDVMGGEVQWGPPGQGPMREVELAEKMSPEQWRKMIGADRFRLSSYDAQQMIVPSIMKCWGKPVNTWYYQAQAHSPLGYQAIITRKPYPVTALITTHSNPMVTEIATKSVYEALTSKNLELYVVLDFFMTPSAELADYVIPSATWLERPGLWSFNDYGNYIWAHEAALPNIIPEKYEHYRDFDFWKGLGIRLGQKEYWPWETLEDAFNERLATLGHTLKDFPRIIMRKTEYKKYTRQGFGTPTGKVELSSTILEKLGYDPLPFFKEAPETAIANPALAERYPLTLITGARARQYYHAEWRHVASVRKLRPYPTVQIHPETAEKHSIEDGDWVWIETERGAVRQKAKLFADMDPNIVSAEHGWWYPELPGEEPSLHGVWISNINVVLSDDPEQCNPELGSWPLRTALCRISRAEEPELSS